MNTQESGNGNKLSSLEDFLRSTHADQGGEAKFKAWVHATAGDTHEYGNPEAVEYLRLWGDLRDKERSTDGQWAHPEGNNIENGKCLFEQALAVVGGSNNEWSPSQGLVSPWEYAIVQFNGATEPVRVGVSAGGVVSVNGHPFTPDRESVLNVDLVPVVRSLLAACVKVGGQPRADAITVLARDLGFDHEEAILKVIREADSPANDGNGYLAWITTDRNEFFRGAVCNSIADIEKDRVLALELWEPRRHGEGQTGLELKVPLKSVLHVEIEW